MWSPDSRLFAAGYSSAMEIGVYDTETGRRLWTFDGDMPAFSHDGRYLCVRVRKVRGWIEPLVGEYSGVVYDLETGLVFAELPKPGIFSPDGTCILMQDGILRLKPLQQLINEAKAKLDGRNLNTDERKSFFID